jgi:hypothetical protein
VDYTWTTTLPERPYFGHWESTQKYTQEKPNEGIVIKGTQYNLIKKRMANYLSHREINVLNPLVLYLEPVARIYIH